MNELYTKILTLKKENPALWNGDFGGSMKRIETSADNKIFAFSRIKEENQVITILNLSPDDVEFTISNDQSSDLTEIFTGEKISNEYNLKAWEYKVFKTN